MAIEPHPHGRVYTAAAGLGNAPVPDDWSYERDRVYFAARSTLISRGNHLFVLGAGRKGAVLGLYEVLSPGTEPVASPEDPERWPYSVAVRPLAGVRPPDAVSVPGVRTPRAFPQAITDPEQQAALYAALDGAPTQPMQELEAGAEYSWEELGARYDFEPDYLGSAGGMVSRPEHGVLLLMTHPGGARSFDYEDYWEGDDLIYTGRGKRGDQKREGQNRDLGDNLKDALVFEPAGPRRLRFLGQATCVNEWRTQAEDIDGNERSVLRFRLCFSDAPGRAGGGAPSGEPGGAEQGETERLPRPFDPQAPPKAPAAPSPNATPEEIQALNEKAVLGHHQLLAELSDWLTASGWQEIAEIPRAVDLWARRPDDQRRVIFEVKTIREKTQSARVRSALAQLFEYRFRYGEQEDLLCLVCDEPIQEHRVRFLESLDIAVLWRGEEGFVLGSGNASELLTATTLVST